MLMTTCFLWHTEIQRLIHCHLLISFGFDLFFSHPQNHKSYCEYDDWDSRSKILFSINAMVLQFAAYDVRLYECAPSIRTILDEFTCECDSSIIRPDIANDGCGLWPHLKRVFTSHMELIFAHSFQLQFTNKRNRCEYFSSERDKKKINAGKR